MGANYEIKTLQFNSTKSKAKSTWKNYARNDIRSSYTEPDIASVSYILVALGEQLPYMETSSGILLILWRSFLIRSNLCGEYWFGWMTEEFGFYVWRKIDIEAAMMIKVKTRLTLLK